MQLSPDLRRRILPVAVFVILFADGIYTADIIATGQYGRMGRTVGGAILATLSLYILQNWRVGVATFFVWITVEDLVRKYAGNDISVYFVKDILIAVTYASFFRQGLPNVKKDFGKWLILGLVIWVLWAVAEVVNPGVPTALVPLLGLRMSFFYLPMLFLGYAFFRSEQQFRRFLVLTLSVAAVISILGIVQSIVGLDFLSPEAGPYLRLNLVRGEMGMEVPRPTSTFVDSGRFARYLFVMVFLGLGFLGYLYAAKRRNQTRIRVWTWLCWVAVWAGLYICGVRAPLVWIVFSVPLLALAYLYSRGRLKKSAGPLPLARIILAGGLGLLVLALAFPKRFEAAYKFYSETLSPTTSQSEFKSRPKSLINELGVALSSSPVFGHGTGTASLGLQYLFGEVVKADTRMEIYHVEMGYPAVIWEWGVIGLVLWFWWSGALVIELFKDVKSLKDTPFYWQSVAIGLYVFFLLFAWFAIGSQVYQDFIAQAFLWFLAGFVFRVAGLVRQRNEVRVAERISDPHPRPFKVQV